MPIKQLKTIFIYDIIKVDLKLSTCEGTMIYMHENIQKLIQKFHLTQNDIDNLKSTPFLTLPSPIINTGRLLKKVKINDIVGSTRPDMDYKNFYEFFNSFHKFYLLNKNFNHVINNPIYNNFPEVLLVEDKYYICGDGKHRIILSMLKQIDEITCAVFKL